MNGVDEVRLYLDTSVIVTLLEGTSELKSHVERQDLYERYFSASEVRMVEIGGAVWDQATHIRARYGFRVPDARHLAAAVLNGCSVIVTRDAQWRRFSEGRVEII